MQKKYFKAIDYGLVIVVLLLFGIGITALYSAGGGIEGDSSDTVKQIIWFGIGTVAIIIIMFIDYEIIGKLWIVLYIGSLIALILVLFTRPINGATSWFIVGGVNIQPSEFMKLAIIIGLAKILTYFKTKDTLNSPKSILLILLFVLVPVLLIIKQPDYGTAMVIVVSSAIMIFMSGIKLRFIISAIIFAVITLPMVYYFVLPQHAKDRIAVFLNPELDPRGKGYNILQSKMAIGSGKLWGMGLFNGNQTQMGILPMKKTDFIYAVISEEMGFIIATLVIILFAILIYRIIRIARTSRDNIGALMCVGICGVFFAHFVENVGMTMGLLPITGIPLPFISYGGSSMLTNMIALGIVLNVSSRRSKIMFLE